MKTERNLERIEKTCCVCGKIEHIHSVSLYDVPVFLGCTTKGEEDDRFVSYDVHQCLYCGLITTNANLGEQSYTELHSEAIGGIWQRHHESFAAFCRSKIDSSAKLNAVLEIGPSSNPVVKYLHERFQNIYYCDMLPEPPFELSANEQYVKGRFPREIALECLDVIIASHVFEHADDLKKFLQNILERLNEDGSFLLSIPNFRHWIGEKYWNAITPEHSAYPFEQHLRYLASACHVYIEIDFFENHSIFARFKKKGKASMWERSFAPQHTDSMLAGWFNFLHESVKKAEEGIVSATEKYTPDAVLLAGASHLSQYPILMSDAIRNKVTNVIDNSDFKSGKRLYGTNVIVEKFEIVSKYKRPVVVIFSSPYQNEMRSQVRTLNPQAIIIT